MKKIIIIFASSMLLLSTMTLGNSESLQMNNQAPELENHVEVSNFNDIEESQILTNINKLDGFFTENRGQVRNDSVRYYIQGKGVWFLDNGVVFEIQEPLEQTEAQHDPLDRFHPEFESKRPTPRKSVALNLNFKGCNEVEPKGVGLLPHKSNFFYGNDSSKWSTGVMNYREIVYNNIYDNIDLVYYTKDNGLKYDFIVHKGGNPNDIRLSCTGMEDLFIDSNCDLRIRTAFGDIVDSGIFIYQNINTEPITVEGRFKILNRNTFGFEILSEYDSGTELIIDPMVYSTYIGSTSFDGGYDIEVDSNGSAYVTGYTDAANFPSTAGAYDTSYNDNYDVFVIKLNHNGSNLLYSTFIGGNSQDEGRCLKLDDNGSIYVGGITSSNNFPTTLNAYDTANNGVLDCFVLRINPLGNGANDLNYSTYLGGSSLDYCHDMALNDSNQIYITGDTQSDSDFPTTVGAYQTTFQGGILDAFFAKINPEGNGTSDLVYSTHLGGSTASSFPAQDMGHGITVDALGYAYITGITYSSNFPTTVGAYSTSITGWADGFITKINPAGNGNSDLLYSTYFGGTNMQEPQDIAIDSTNNAVVVGRTSSNDFPTTPNAFDTSFNVGIGGDIFVLKLDPAGNGANDLKYSTYIGGPDDDWGHDIVVDDFGDAIIIGHSMCQTPPSAFPTTANAFDNTHNGQWDVVVVKLGLSGGNLSYSSFIGGGLTDMGYGIAIDSDLKMYATGYCSGPDFPNTTGAFDQTFNGGWQDAFACKLEYNNVPHVLDLNLSPHSVFRTQKIYLNANATDIEDYEHNLTPHFEYRDSTKQIWNSTYFSAPQYNNSRFEVNFTPPKNATLGLYDIRVRVNDTVPLLSDWFILNDTLLVLNNFPNLVDLKLSNSKSIQNKNVSLWINGTDIEDPENNLTIEMMYRDPNEQSWNVTFLGAPKYFDNKWLINFSANFSTPFGNYDFRVRVNDSDGNFSKWSYKNDSLLIYNLNPEVLDIELSKTTIFRIESLDLYVNGSDYETIESTLIFTIQYKSDLNGIWKNLTGSYINNRWQATFAAGKGAALGSYDFRTRFQDINNGISKWQYLNDSLNVQNNPPLIEDLLLSKSNAKLSDTVKIWVNGNDLEEPEDNLTVILRYRDPNEQSWDGSYISSAKYIGDKWEFEFDLPYDAPFGYYDFKARLNDSDGSFTEWIYNNDSLLIYNTPPSVLDIILSKSSIKRTETMYLAVNGIDYETPESMLSIYIQYKPNAKIDWIDLSVEYSNDNASWETKVLTTIDSDLGYYDFRAKFEDNETLSSGWFYQNDSFEVLNNLPEISNELDEINITTEPKLIDLTEYESDIEDNNEDLIWSVDEKEYNYLESVTITDTINDILKINPLDNVIGDVDIKLILTDKDSGTTTKSDITLHIDSRTIEFKPKVTLLSPPDKATINTLTPTLRWELDYPGTELITYSVTLDDNPDPLTTIKTGLTSAEYTLENDLVDGKTYYWKVMPTNGICLSGSFRFTIDLGFEPFYKVNLTTERDSIIIKQGEAMGLNLTVQNLGNVIDMFKIEYSSSELQSNINIDNSKIQLAPNIESKIKLNVNIPDGFELGKYSIDIKATSLSDQSVDDEVIITIEIVDKDFMPNYKVTLLVPSDSIDIEQGKSDNYTITIINEGNIVDEYTINFESDDFSDADIKISKSKISLDAGNEEQVIVTITVPENIAPGEYQIKFNIQSDFVSKNTTLNVEVEAKEDAQKPDDKQDEDSTMLYAIIGIIIAIIIVLIILFMFLRKKRPQAEELVEEDQPMEVPSQEQPPPTPEIPTEQSPQEMPAPDVPPPTPTPQVEELPQPEITFDEKIIPPAPKIVKKPQLQPTEEPTPLPQIQPEVLKLPPPKLKQPKIKPPSESM